MTEVDSNSLNAELEVKKLQELVRKLERQNEQLRTRVSGPLSPLLCQSSLGSFAFPDEPFDYFHPHTAGDGAAAAVEDGPEQSVLDELELLDLDSLCSSDESDETWLYVSSKPTESTNKSTSPLHWSRQVLDSPRSEVEAARQLLSLRLEQVSRWRSSLHSPTSFSSPGPTTPTPAQVTGVSPVSTPPSAKPCSISRSSERHGNHAASALPSPLHPVLHQNLSPGGKELSPVAERSPTFLPHPANRSRSLRCSALSPQSSMDSNLGASEVEDSSISLGYKLQDLTDVQVMARLQEESLRQAYASTSSILANRRSQSFSFQLSTGLEEEDEEDDEDYGLLPPPQPCLTRLPHSHTFSSIQDWQRSTSSLSTPLYPSGGLVFRPQPLGSLCAAEHLGFRPGSDKMRRSTPNLLRSPSMPSVPLLTNSSTCPSLLHNSNNSSFDSSNEKSSQLHSRFLSSRPPLKATAYVSPTIKGSASMLTSTSLQSLSSTCQSTSTPRSSLPRPASFVGTTSFTPRSKVAQPPRSLLTPPKSLSTLSALLQDGCY
ncbi:SLAIN motif-containing protein 1-like [Mastacembelus armatus]|uniref:SLAIN motif-containing protein 1-like n=1 Tax=Mastacembelus armatus TaxID=205130 RepID=UPI000E457CA2|nr:SLAIN motif-containing protein 1-like [Mastacembelus armatus]